MNTFSQVNTSSATVKSGQRVSDLMPFRLYKPQMHLEKNPTSSKHPHVHHRPNREITKPDETIGNNNIYKVNQGGGCREIYLMAGSSDNTLEFGSGITPDMLHFEKSPHFSPLFPKFTISVLGSQSDDSVIITESLNDRFALSSRFKDISVDGQTLPMETIRTALRKNEQPVWLAKETPPVLDNKVVPIVEKIAADTLKAACASPTEIQMLTNAMASFGENGLVSFSKDVISDAASTLFRVASPPQAFRFLMTTL
ncbi:MULTISPECIES: hypothetical protein [Yersinia]|jgi:hypothetical protein|uniref:hypothetical protein n=1 Tax=Yersinia TaxID=629 RepID=UPI0005E5CAAD|nr:MULTISPECIES: hypothetical protein [Yersinia]CNK64525.1 Uncharacterised protein [Yersinia frederiksenii]HEC1649008.1 hypothetical protein [Yersinia enterocolitica]HEI6965104.1 hypothetical protein [Yersinia enterocolitica]